MTGTVTNPHIRLVGGVWMEREREREREREGGRGDRELN